LTPYIKSPLYGSFLVKKFFCPKKFFWASKITKMHLFTHSVNKIFDYFFI
jgi:hypothetical protein